MYKAEQTVKYYAVRQGKQPGIYSSWPECRDQIHGYSGAAFKSFDTLEAAQAYLEAQDPQQDIDLALPYAYIDGSNRQDGSLYGYGGFIFNGGRYTIIQGTGCRPEYLPERNIAGEITGALKVVDQCLRDGIPEINIYYDYAGIADWISGSWEAKTPLARYYKDTLELLQTDVKLHFIKVQGHTGIAGNELADKLAKEAVGAKLRKKDIAALENFRAEVKAG